MLTMLPADTSITLAEVKSQFSHWRATRHKRCKIPEDLWDGVRQLSTKYTYSQISAALGLNLQQLRAKMQTDCSDDQRSEEASNFDKVEFVAAAFSPLASYASTSQTSALELSRPDGTMLKATGLGQQETLALVERFLG